MSTQVLSQLVKVKDTRMAYTIVKPMIRNQNQVVTLQVLMYNRLCRLSLRKNFYNLNILRVNVLFSDKNLKKSMM